MNSSIHSPHVPNLTLQGNRLHVVYQGWMGIGKGSFAALGLQKESSSFVLPGKEWKYEQ